jgi:ornithine decarboxylase
MRQAMRVGAKPPEIIYAHPCKSPSDIRAANRLGIPNTVVDSPEEVIKLAEQKWKGGVIVRLMVSDAGSEQPFSKKFGAPLSWVPDILYALRSSGIQHNGWSFHVGSMCTQPNQFAQAIERCAEAQEHATSWAKIVDIGGGFVPQKELFESAANEIRSSFRHFSSTATQWIAEPGRFIASPVITMQVQVTGVKRRLDSAGKQTGWRYTVDESLYGAFSNIAFDGQKPVFRLMDSEAKRPRVRATIFGRTCDSADCLAEDIEIPELHVGDWLSIENMGAYTLVSSSEFNGFPYAHRIYE